MKNGLFISSVISVMILSTLFFGGCTTYHGQVDTSVPIQEQCLIEIRGHSWTFSDKWGVHDENHDGATALIPAGTHEVHVVFTIVENYTKDGRYEKWTEYKSSLKTTYTFTSGYTYFLGVSKKSGTEREYYIVIEPRKTPDKAKSAFVIPQFNFGMGYGNNYGADFGLNILFPLQFGAVIDTNIITTALYIDAGTHISATGVKISSEDDLMYRTSNGFSSVGISAEFFPKSTRIGLGVGTGIASATYGFFEAPVSPYIRGLFIVGKKSPLKIYFDYYMPEILSEKRDINWYTGLPDTPYTATRKWGLGLFWYRFWNLF